ncbi:hypothetical protein O0L34_g5766 [Tuta absoluta]|nr:hypothetical protein O0L34_g5766 [Tuta absoluta]
MISTKAEVKMEEDKQSYGLGLRHVQCLMLFLALVICFAMRANISMAIVSMTDPRDEKSFHWSVQVQSLILSSFFWGYVILNIPAGELATRFGGKILIAYSVGINSVVSLLLPIASYYGGWQIVCACRVVQGLSQGLVYPSTHYLLGKWAPLEEKSRLGTFVYAGGQFGTAIELMASGFISECWGWPFIFYSCGIIGVIWTGLWIFIGADTPQKSTMITEKERFYIQNSLGQIGTPKKFTTPWKSIWTSVPFWSLLIAHCGQNWGYWTLMTEMPSYMSQVLGVNIKANGVMSALPYLTMYAMSFPLGYLSDLAIRKNWFSITTSRKISNSVGQFGPALFLIGLAYAPPGNVAAAVAMLIITVGLNAGHYTGFLLVHIDMSQNFAGVMMGITNCIANVTGIIAPLVAGILLKDETNPADWRKVFFVAMAVYILCNVVFLAFGSSERQKWDIITDVQDDKKDEEAQKEINQDSKTQHTAL